MKVVIEVEFGSDFQEEIHSSSLVLMLKAYKQFMELKHKKNLTTYKIS